MKITKVLHGMIASAFLVLFGTPAYAGLMLKLDAGNGNSVTISDQGVGDLDGESGVIRWSGSLGTWLFNFTTGISNSPALNGPAILNLTSFNATSRRGGTLTITLIDSGLMNPTGPSNLTTAVTGSTTGTASFASLFNSTPTTGFGPFHGSFNGSAGATVDTTGGFSLTHVATINHAGSGFTGFSMVTAVPEPAILGLLGVGLIAFGALLRGRTGARKGSD